MSARDRILAKLNAAPVLQKQRRISPPGTPHIAVPKAPPKKPPASRNCIEFAHAEVYAVSRASWLQKIVGSTVGQTGRQTARSARHGPRCAGHRRIATRRNRVQRLRQRIEDWKEEMFHDIPASLTVAAAPLPKPARWSCGPMPRAAPDVAGAAAACCTARCVHHPQHLLRGDDGRRMGRWPADQRPAHFRPVEDRRYPGDAGLWSAWPKELVVLLIGDEA